MSATALREDFGEATCASRGEAQAQGRFDELELVNKRLPIGVIDEVHPRIEQRSHGRGPAPTGLKRSPGDFHLCLGWFVRCTDILGGLAGRSGSEAERVTACPEFLHHYNHHRGHTALKGAAPADRVPNLSGQNT